MIFLYLAPSYQQSPWTTSKIQVEHSIASLTSYEQQSTGLKQKRLKSIVRGLNLGEKCFSLSQEMHQKSSPVQTMA